MVRIASIIVLATMVGLAPCASYMLAQTIESKQISLDGFVDGRTGVEKIIFTGLDDSGTTDGQVSADLKLELRRRGGDSVQKEMYILDKERVTKTVEIIIEYLSERGYFKAQVRAFGQDLGDDRMKLVFSIEKGEAYKIAGVRFVGLRRSSNEELVAELRSCLKEDKALYDARHVDYCVQKKVRGRLFSVGLFQAKIGQAERRFNGNSVEIIFDVNEGTRYRIGTIKVDGATVFSNAFIREILGQRTGDVANGILLQDALYEKLKEAYADKGYPQYIAEFEPDFIAPTRPGDDGRVNLGITVDEGRRFKIKNIRFVGVEPAFGEILLQSLSVRPGDVYIASKFEADIAALNRILFDFEEIDKDANVSLYTDEEAAEIELVILLRRFEVKPSPTRP